MHAITACLLEGDEPIHNLFRRANKMHVTPDYPLVSGCVLPRGLVTSGEGRIEIVRGYGILIVENSFMLRPRFFLRVVTDDVRIE